MLCTHFNIIWCLFTRRYTIGRDHWKLMSLVYVRIPIQWTEKLVDLEELPETWNSCAQACHLYSPRETERLLPFYNGQASCNLMRLYYG